MIMMKKVELQHNLIKEAKTTIFGSIIDPRDYILDKKNYIEEIYDKHKQDIKLNREDLIYLYDIYRKGNIINEYNITKYSKIICRRNKKEDIAIIYNCHIDEIAENINEFLKNPEYYIVLLDDLNLDDIDSLNAKKLRYVYGEVICNKDSLSAFNLPNLEVIDSFANFNCITSSIGLESLKVIGVSANFGCLKDASSLFNLEYIGGDAAFQSLFSSTGLDSLRYIGGSAIFYHLMDASSLKKLRIINECGLFYNLSDMTGLDNLEYVGKGLTIDTDVIDGLEKLGMNTEISYVRDNYAKVRKK